ncbi:hypothetical protein [Streptomyces sp. NPDC056817]|uniref:hypothetical protein n=1 Tax=Streptomyces sp. NPDC056817 TaxID=3345950 RepID=UPI0036855BEA
MTETVTETSRVDHDIWRQCISRDPRVKQNTYAVGMAFAMFGNYRDGTDVYPSMATIAEMVCLSSATKVHPHRKTLVECGYLLDTGRKSAAGTVVYHFTAPNDVIAAVQEGRDRRIPGKPVSAPQKPSEDVPGQSEPQGEEKPSTARTGPLELDIEHKAFFLGGGTADEWRWPAIPYAEAEHAYMVYTGRVAA